MDDRIADADAAELQRFAAHFDVDIRATKESPRAAARFVREECPVELDDAVVRVNGLRLEGRVAATPCSPYSYSASVPQAEDHRYVFEVAYRSSHFTRTVVAEPVSFTEPEPGTEIGVHESFSVSWDRPIEDAKVSVAQCVYTRYAEEVGETSAYFRSVRLADSPPCTANVTIRISGAEPMPAPFRGGELHHYITQRVPIRVTR